MSLSAEFLPTLSNAIQLEDFSEKMALLPGQPGWLGVMVLGWVELGCVVVWRRKEKPSELALSWAVM